MSDWITYDTTGGTGNAVITITASSNSELTQRIKTLKVETVSHKKTANVVCTQERNWTRLAVSTDYLYFSGNTGETQIVCVTSETSWSITISEPWIHTSKTGSTGQDCFTVSTDGLSGDDIRWGEITITDGEDTATIFVVQSGDDYHYLIGVYNVVGSTAIATGPNYNASYTEVILQNAPCRVDKGDWKRVNDAYDYNLDYDNLIEGDGYHIVEFDLTGGHRNIDRRPSPYFDNYVPLFSFVDYRGAGDSYCGGIMPGDKTSVEFIILTEGIVGFDVRGLAGNSVKKIEIRSSVLEGNPGGYILGDNIREYRVITLKEDSSTSIPGISSPVLEKVVIPSYLKALGRFHNCTNLTDYSFVPAGLTYLGGFSNNPNLTSFSFPSGITSYGDYAFDGCSNLTSISALPNTDSIPRYAFRNCINLAINITIPSACTTIGKSAFENTPIQSVDFASGATIETIGDYSFAGTNITDITLPNSVTDIGAGAFSNCEYLYSFDFPSYISVIKSYVLSNCYSLHYIHIPKSVYSIYGGAFFTCTSLEEIRIDAIVCPKTERTVAQNKAGTIPGIYYDSPFHDIKRNGTLNYPTGSDYSLWESVGAIRTSDGETSYAEYLGTFNWECSSSVTPSGETLTIIPADNTVSTRYVLLYSGGSFELQIKTNYVWELGINGDFLTASKYSGFGNDTVAITYTENTTTGEKTGYIGIAAGLATTSTYSNNFRKTLYVKQLYDTSLLPQITAVYNIDTTGDSSILRDAGNVVEMNVDNSGWIVPSSIYSFESVGQHTIKYRLNNPQITGMFGGSPPQAGYELIGIQDLVSVTITNSAITSIGAYSFCNCYHLTGVTIGENIQSIGAYAFRSTKIQNINIPLSCTYIGDYAFQKAEMLTRVTIPSATTVTFGDYVFCSATSLYEFTIPKSIVYVTAGLFSGCTNLHNVTIPDSVKTLRGNVFNGCTNLYSITIPNSVIQIGGLCFKDCSNLQTIYAYPLTAPTIYRNTFENVSYGGVLHYPSGSYYGDWTGYNGGNGGKLAYTYGWTAVAGL